MRRFMSGLAASVVLTALPGTTALQTLQPKSVTASVTVTTSDSRRNIAVLSEGEPRGRPRA
jgi:hypothetical protein